MGEPELYPRPINWVTVPLVGALQKRPLRNPVKLEGVKA